MKNNRLQKYESKIEPEASPEQIQQAKEWAVNRIMETYVRLPANPAPVKESFLEFAELARQANSGVKVPKKSTLIISGGSLEVPKKLTDIDTGTSEKVPPKFTDFENELLRKIQNGEQ
jgi:hypothetical protein